MQMFAIREFPKDKDGDFVAVGAPYYMDFADEESGGTRVSGWHPKLVEWSGPKESVNITSSEFPVFPLSLFSPEVNCRSLF